MRSSSLLIVVALAALPAPVARQAYLTHLLVTHSSHLRGTRMPCYSRKDPSDSATCCPLIMSHKRTRASAQIDESKNKFHCEEAKLRYESVFKNQKMHLEKDEELVREFYANLTSSELTKVSACEIKVPITSNAINELFSLPDFEDDEYSSMMSNIESKNLQEIFVELMVPELMEPVTKPDVATSMFKTQSPCLDLRDELSKLMDIMQHMQWQQ
ncbi:hypothetical protein PVK06_007849 [Gossypium arboreum]|uniref:Uncharacterized protein n=1 Tax=Gossypium arboreum TaxID=29729 RepID=A0ABR0QJA3_GOSAR|nr:hypothetical protein PVK06_007849 [Gossypium arboreum]